MIMLQIKNVTVTYGKITAVWDANLCVEPGHFVALVGANGAGKTSLLKAIMGLVPLASGHIFFENQNIRGLPPWRISERGISLVPEGARVFPDLTVMHNLLVGGFRIANKATLKSRLDYVWRLFPVLQERQRQPAGTLSGGERQMLAIARALMSKPRLLLVDEISMGLMPILVKQVFSTLLQLNKEGVSILMAEQNVQETFSVASFAYVMENGRIVLAGKPSELLNNECIKISYLGI